MYVVISKDSLSAIALERAMPSDGAYGNAWVVPVPDGYTIVLPTRAEDGSCILGTTWTLDQILAYVAKYENLVAKQQAALNAAIAQVNGTAIMDLTVVQLRLLLLILVAERGWITADNKISITL